MILGTYRPAEVGEEHPLAAGDRGASPLAVARAAVAVGTRRGRSRGADRRAQPDSARRPGSCAVSRTAARATRSSSRRFCATSARSRDSGSRRGWRAGQRQATCCCAACAARRGLPQVCCAVAAVAGHEFALDVLELVSGSHASGGGTCRGGARRRRAASSPRSRVGADTASPTRSFARRSTSRFRYQEGAIHGGSLRRSRRARGAPRGAGRYARLPLLAPPGMCARRSTTTAGRRRGGAGLRQSRPRWRTRPRRSSRCESWA